LRRPRRISRARPGARSKQKRLQELRGPALFPAGMLGQNMASGAAGPAFRLRLRLAPVSAPVRACSTIPVEARRSVRPFAQRRRPAPCDAIPQPRQRSRPTSSQRSTDLHGPAACVTPLPASFRSRARSLRRSPSPSRSEDSPAVLRPPLPFGTFRSRRIVALNLLPAEEACPCESPDLPSLPATPKRFHSMRRGSTFQIRYVPPG
jgi:hypothetical protein